MINNTVYDNSHVNTISKLIDDCDGIYSNLKRNISDYKYRTDDIVANLEKNSINDNDNSCFFCRLPLPEVAGAIGTADGGISF